MSGLSVLTSVLYTCTLLESHMFVHVKRVVVGSKLYVEAKGKRVTCSVIVNYKQTEHETYLLN